MSDLDNSYLPPEYAEKIVDGAQKIVSRGGDGMQPGDVGEIEDLDAPDAEIFAADGANIGGLHVVLGAQDGVPYVSLVELEHLFANLYEDISEREAKKQRKEAERKEAELSGTMALNVGNAEAKLAEEQRIDDADDRPLWRVEVDYALNHVRNAIASWMGL